MAKAFIDDVNLTNIANAIRSVNETTTTYYPSEMADAINTFVNLKNDSYLWGKYNSDPSVIIETSKTNQNICAKRSGSYYLWNKIYYADEIENIDGKLSLVNPKFVQWEASNTNPSSNASVLLGKYILSDESFATSIENYYFIPTSATFTTTSTSSGYLLKVSSATKLEGQTMINYVTSKSSDTYPTNGEHTDGYWYVYKGLMSDIMSGSSSNGVTMKSGTTTSSTINTGLSSISTIVIYKDSLSATGLIQGIYSTNDNKLHYTYCPSYSTYVKTCSVGTSTASSVSGGTFTLVTDGESNSDLSSNTTYNWIAFGVA